MTSSFDELYEKLMSGEEILDESVLLKTASFIDFLQKTIEKGLKAIKKPAPPKVRDLSKPTPSELEKEKESRELYREFADKLFSYDIDNLTPEQISDIEYTAQNTMDQMSAYENALVDKVEVAKVKQRVDFLIDQFLSQQTHGLFTEPGISIKYPSVEKTWSGGPPDRETEYKTRKEAAKALLKRIRKIIETKYDMESRRITWGDKFVDILMALGIVKTIKFE